MSNILADIFKKGLFNIKVSGDSMYPILHDQDVVSFKKIKINQVKKNDILLLYKLNHFFVHRLIYKTDKYLITKGDNNNYDDGKINKKNLLGKAIFVKRSGQKFNIEHFYLAQSSVYFDQIANINKTLTKENINFAFIKGLPINLHYFKKHSQRFFYDCDVLIPVNQKKEVINIFKELGYKKTSTDIFKKREDFWQESFYKTVNGFPVVFDIHYQVSFLMTQISNLDCLYPLNLVNNMSKEIIKNRQIIKINGNYYPVISKVYLALLLLLHYFHHNFQEIYQLEKISNLISKLSRPQIKQLMALINYYQVNKYIYPCLFYLNKYFQSDSSKQLLKTFKLKNKNTMVLIDSMKMGPFNKRGRVEAGIVRFKLLFYLSPRPLIKKIFIFANPEVVFLIYKILDDRLRNFFNNFFVKKL